MEKVKRVGRRATSMPDCLLEELQRLNLKEHSNSTDRQTTRDGSEKGELEEPKHKCTRAGTVKLAWVERYRLKKEQEQEALEKQIQKEQEAEAYD